MELENCSDPISNVDQYQIFTQKEDEKQKFSFFEIKKKLILKEFINILKNIN